MKEMIAEGNVAEDWEEGLYIVKGYELRRKRKKKNMRYV
jgi:hypothetical protein